MCRAYVISGIWSRADLRLLHNFSGGMTLRHRLTRGEGLIRSILGEGEVGQARTSTCGQRRASAQADFGFPEPEIAGGTRPLRKSCASAANRSPRQPRAGSVAMRCRLPKHESGHHAIQRGSHTRERSPQGASLVTRPRGCGTRTHAEVQPNQEVLAQWLCRRFHAPVARGRHSLRPSDARWNPKMRATSLPSATGSISSISPRPSRALMKRSRSCATPSRGRADSLRRYEEAGPGADLREATRAEMPYVNQRWLAAC